MRTRGRVIAICNPPDSIQRGWQIALWQPLAADDTLQAVLITTTFAGTFITPDWKMIQHVIDHSSYPRGHIVTMLCQLGLAAPRQA
jgi:uncharacterized damage-inducible protein DinB